MADIRELLKSYKPFDSVEARSLELARQYLEKQTDIYSRKNFAGHFAGGAFTLNKARTHALLVHHAQLGLWLQPGGHTEAEDVDIFATAIRELREESGIAKADMPIRKIFDFDAHEIPDNPRKQEPRHYHFEARVLMLAQEDLLIISNESADIQWVPLEKIPALGSPSLTRMTRKALAFLGKEDGGPGWRGCFLEG